jgi:hypothetical protein
MTVMFVLLMKAVREYGKQQTSTGAKAEAENGNKNEQVLNSSI